MGNSPSEDSEGVPISPQSKHSWFSPQVLNYVHRVSMLYIVSKVTTHGRDLKGYLPKPGWPNENSGDWE